MEYFIGESGSTGRKFSSVKDFMDALLELVSTYEENGEECFEIEVANG